MIWTPPHQLWTSCVFSCPPLSFFFSNLGCCFYMKMYRSIKDFFFLPPPPSKLRNLPHEFNSFQKLNDVVPLKHWIHRHTLGYVFIFFNNTEGNTEFLSIPPTLDLRRTENGQLKSGWNGHSNHRRGAKQRRQPEQDFVNEMMKERRWQVQRCPSKNESELVFDFMFGLDRHIPANTVSS